jgi:hypothetical protein
MAKLKTNRTMEKHILSWYNKASEHQLKTGLNWYKDAQLFADQSGKYNAWKLSQIISVLSPQISWTTNLENAAKMWNCLQSGNDVLGLKIFATELQKVHCQEIYNHDYEIPKTAIKTYNFARNIYNQNDINYVTIDRHAYKVAVNCLKGGSVSLTRKQYTTIADCYKKVARKLGITPCQLQAITWVTYKDFVGR